MITYICVNLSLGPWHQGFGSGMRDWPYPPNRDPTPQERPDPDPDTWKTAFAPFHKNFLTYFIQLEIVAFILFWWFSDLFFSWIRVHPDTYRVFIKYCVFSKNSRKFATSPSPALGCYWFYTKLPANRSDWTLALRWELWRSIRVM